MTSEATVTALRRENAELRSKVRELREATSASSPGSDAAALFRFVDAQKAEHSIALLCRTLGVSRSGYYAWVSRPPSERSHANAWLLAVVRRLHAESGGAFGARRVHAQLEARGIHVNVKRVERLMRAAGLRGRSHPSARSAALSKAPQSDSAKSLTAQTTSAS